MRNDRWASSREILHTLCPGGKPGKGGQILYHSNGQNWVYPYEGHSILLGVSGSGKSRRGTIPAVKSFIESEESFVTIDPKGEIHYHTASDAEKKNYNIHVIDFRHIFESERWNPLAAPYEHFISGDPVRKQIAIEMIDELAHTLYPVVDHTDPFWPESARDVFLGATYALMMLGKPEQIHMSSVYQLIIRGQERFGGSTYLKAFAESLPDDSIASMLLYGYINTATETRGSILSVFLKGLSMFARSEGLISMLSSDDLHINRLDGSVPTAIYIILPDESPIFDSLAGVLCSQIMEHYIRLAQDKYNGRLPRRLNVCLEELGNIGMAIPSLPHLMSAGRSRNIRCQLVLQSLSQLDTLYGAEKASTICSNADVLIAFRTNHWKTLQELSHKCGEREVEINHRVSRESLITPSQLASMQTGQALVIISGRTRFITWLPDFTEMFDCSQWKAPKHTMRKASAPVSAFDIQDYTKEAKKRKLRELINATEDLPEIPSEHNQAQQISSQAALPPLKETKSKRETATKSRPKRTTTVKSRPKEESSARSGPKEEPSAEMQALLDAIDKKIAEIQAEEAKEAMKTKEAKEHLSDLPFVIESDSCEVTLLSADPSRIEVNRAICKYTFMRTEDAYYIAAHLPFTFSLPGKKIAMQFLHELSAAGADAYLGGPKDNEAPK